MRCERGPRNADQTIVMVRKIILSDECRKTGDAKRKTGRRGGSKMDTIIITNDNDGAIE